MSWLLRSASQTIEARDDDDKLTTALAAIVDDVELMVGRVVCTLCERRTRGSTSTTASTAAATSAVVSVDSSTGCEMFARVDMDEVRRRCRDGADTRAGDSREKAERRAVLGVAADRRGVEAAVE